MLIGLGGDCVQVEGPLARSPLAGKINFAVQAKDPVKNDVYTFGLATARACTANTYSLLEDPLQIFHLLRREALAAVADELRDQVLLLVTVAVDGLHPEERLQKCPGRLA